MTTFRLELDARPTEAELTGLQADLAPYANVENADQNYTLESLATAAFFVSFFSDAIQGVDVLLTWLKGLRARRPQMHTAAIRLADGRHFEVKTDDEDALRAALLAILE